MDRLLPSSPEAERAVIGSCLIEPEQCLTDAQSVLNLGSFYDHRNRLLWGHISALKPSQCNTVNLYQILNDCGDLNKIGGMAYVSQCQDEVPSTANLSEWLSILEQKKVQRDIIAVCTDAITEAYNSPRSAFDLLDEVERRILAVRPIKSSQSDIKSLCIEAMNRIESRYNSGDKITGLSTGLADLDRMSDGLHPGEMVVLAGFPSTGKTALGVNVAVSLSIQKVPAAIFSAEMRPVQLVVRSICSESRVNFHRVRDTDFPALMSAVTKISTAPLYIEQASQLSVGQIQAMARRLKQKFNIKVAVIDYIQLLRGTGDNREQEISNISKGIKAMAMELDIAVIALSQVNDDGRLRESRAIGQDADTVWKLENQGEVQASVQPIALHVIKCRDGATGCVELTFMKEHTRFENRAKVSPADYPRNED